MNMNLYVTFSINIWRNQKMNLLYKFGHQNEINFFSIKKVKINLEHRT